MSSRIIQCFKITLSTPNPENTIAHHDIEEYSSGYRTDIHNEYQFVVCKDFKGMDWYINEIAIPYEADVSKWKEIMLKVFPKMI